MSVRDELAKFDLTPKMEQTAAEPAVPVVCCWQWGTSSDPDGPVYPTSSEFSARLKAEVHGSLLWKRAHTPFLDYIAGWERVA